MYHISRPLVLIRQPARGEEGGEAPWRSVLKICGATIGCGTRRHRPYYREELEEYRSRRSRNPFWPLFTWNLSRVSWSNRVRGGRGSRRRSNFKKEVAPTLLLQIIIFLLVSTGRQIFDAAHVEYLPLKNRGKNFLFFFFHWNHVFLLCYYIVILWTYLWIDL